MIVRTLRHFVKAFVSVTVACIFVLSVAVIAVSFVMWRWDVLSEIGSFVGMVRFSSVIGAIVAAISAVHYWSEGCP